MTDPKLRIPASGFGGSGYKNPVTGEKVIGVTTALGIIDKPGIVQWHIDNTAAYAVASVDQLLNRTEEEGYRFLRYYTKRFKAKDFDNPQIDIHDYSVGVLNDLAELGDLVHEWVEADLNDWFEPDLVRQEQAEIIEQYLIWKSEHDIEVACTEATFFGSSYAGTGDWIGKIDGVWTLVDNKTSRSTWDEQKAQLAALGACDTWMREVPAGTPGAFKHERTTKGVKQTSWWIPTEMPPIQQYAILHMRPNDYDNKGNFVPAFCELKIIPQEEIDTAFEMFEGSLTIRYAMNKLKQMAKARGEKEEEDD